MSSNLKYAVFGSGSWATAIIKMLCENLDEVGWFIRKQQTIDYILSEEHNPSYLSSVELHTNKLMLACDINKLADYADILIFAIPSAFIEIELAKLNTDISSKIIVSAVKGIIPESGHLVGEHFQRKHAVKSENTVVLAGPCHAEEVALERLSYITVVCANLDTANEIAEQFSSNYIKINTNDDVIGAEYAAMIKNVYAIAAGIAHGLGYGDNFLSVLISNAIREIQRFLDVVHPINRDIKDSAYLGDLLVTAYSKFSRNRTFGTYIGKGYSVRAAQLDMNMIAEGYYAVKSIHEINKEHGVLMPITDAVYHMVYEKTSPRLEFKKLSDQLD